MRLPVITGFGGINAAGRGSAHHAYRRMVIEALPARLADGTWHALASLTGRDWDGSDAERSALAAATLVRRIESAHFDVDAVPWHRRLIMEAGGGAADANANAAANAAASARAGTNAPAATFRLRARQLPDAIPPGWQLAPVDETHVDVRIDQEQLFLLPALRESAVKAAGQLPSGFEPGSLYPARSHPRGLQMAVYAASDALGGSGLNWDELRGLVGADQISVYAGSSMSQLDAAGNGGMVKARYLGRKVTSKYCPFGFAEMPADFINAYVLGNYGSTGTNMGACASFLYNLRQGIGDIQSGRARIAIVGNSEAPITPEIIEGYAAMGALATDKGLRELDGVPPGQEPDHRRACRPFADNCGFTIAESAQMIILFDDELAMETGAQVFGAVSDVFVNADGYKKSISSPGVGNYITVAKALAAARAIVGEEALRRGGHVQAHGTGTPQNRVTESHILNEAAKCFGIEAWPVVAVKSCIGHSIGAAGADQLAATLGIWAHGIAPGIRTIGGVADDVHCSHLDIAVEHRALDGGGGSGGDAGAQRYAILNAKGFGGNNASAAALSPAQTCSMLAKRHGEKTMLSWRRKQEAVSERAARFEAACLAGQARPIYRYDYQVLGGGDVEFDGGQLRIKGGAARIDLNPENPYADMS